ncbi:hypothetical protein D3C77_689440 [compost metagenome]
MAILRLERGLQHPDPVRLVAHELRIDSAGLEQVGVLDVRPFQAVAVVGDVQLALADQLPVVAIR